MATISYKEIETHIAEATASGYAPIYLIYGDELLVTETYQSIRDALIPEASSSLNFEVFDGMDADMSNILEGLNTFSLLGGPKVVALLTAQLFESSKDQSRLLTQAKQAAEANDNRKAARYFLSVLSLQGLVPEDLKPGVRQELLKMDAAGVDDGEWLDGILTFCRENDLPLPEPQGQAALLEKAIGRGFPSGNHLIITTERVDKRKKLYSVIGENGIIVDCSLPKGDRRADRQVQGKVLRERLEEALQAQGKTMSSGVFDALYEKSGFDLRTFTTNIEKLIDYTGDRPAISTEDVESVLTRTKKDPIYEFTNAVTSRDMEGALFYMHSLLDSGELSHPLQLLAAVTNQVRKLILIKEFIDSPNGDSWDVGLPFQRFRQEVMPLIQEHDTSLKDLLEEWANSLTPADQDQKSKKEPKKRKRRKAAVKTDLLIAPNPNNAYPVYLMMKKADKFSRQELLDAYAEILEADLAIKSGKHQPSQALERLITRLTSA